jgi:hypothetical protein
MLSLILVARDSAATRLVTADVDVVEPEVIGFGLRDPIAPERG